MTWPNSTPCSHWLPHVCRDRPGLPSHPTLHSRYVVGAMVGRRCDDSKCLIKVKNQGTFCVRTATAELRLEWNSSPLVRRGRRRRGCLALSSPGAPHSCLQHHGPLDAGAAGLCSSLSIRQRHTHYTPALSLHSTVHLTVITCRTGEANTKHRRLGRAARDSGQGLESVRRKPLSPADK